MVPNTMKVEVVARRVLGLDRRLLPRLALHLPADVDLQAGVRRVRPRHRSPQVLLKVFPRSLRLAFAVRIHLNPINFWLLKALSDSITKNPPSALV
ncbi:actin, muscle-type A2 [Batrachochytrium salamandrivorans]|nr:actin, muscle-type A2 [Batrachochytrium salamandrivorans]